MDKRISRIISSTVIITAISMTGADSNMNFFYNTKAYATSCDLTSLDMSGGKLYENSNYTKEIDNDNIKDTYYVKLSYATTKISINAECSDGGVVSITKQGGSKIYKSGDDIAILPGKTTLKVTVYQNEEDREKKRNAKSTYKIKIKRYTKEEEDEIKNDTQDNIYLQSLELDYGNIPLGFRRDKMNYDVTVDKDVKTLAIKAIPEDGAYDVRVNGLKLDEDKGYKKNINITPNATTKVEITLSYDEDEFRTYTINITPKDKDAEKNNSDSNSDDKDKNNSDTNKNETASNKNENVAVNNSTNTSSVTDSKDNVNTSEDKNQKGWIKDGQRWKYIDDYGNILKNTLFYDRNYGKNYYFNNDGYMETGWKNLNNAWYYFDNSGAMIIGWYNVSGKWYYLNYDGRMKTGWFKDSDGKYYYFYTSGEMASNTTIDGYNLGSDGAWTGK